MSLLKETSEVTTEFTLETSDSTRLATECIFFESAGDTSKYGTATMGGGSTSHGPDRSTEDAIGTKMRAVKEFTSRAVKGMGETSLCSDEPLGDKTDSLRRKCVQNGGPHGIP